MRKQYLLNFTFLLLIGALLFNACKKDDDGPKELTLETLMAGDADLNSATAPTGILVNSAIVATFSTDVDPATATDANITLVQDYDDYEVDVTISVSGNQVTITPGENLATGTLFQLSFSSALLSVDGEALTALTRSFTTEGTFAPAGVIAHWTFEDSAEDVVGDYDPATDAVVAITYTASRNAAAGKAATFDGDASIIEVPNGDQLITTSDFTLSFWVKTNSDGHVDGSGNPAGHFVIGLGAFYGLQFEMFGSYEGAKFAIQYELEDGTGAAEDMWFPAEAQDNTNGGWQGWDYAKSLTAAEMVALLKDTWLNVVYTYDGTSKRGTLYYNGEKMKSFDFNLWPDGDAKQGVQGLLWAGLAPDVLPEMAFGFIQSRGGTLWDTEAWGGYDFPTANHFKGQLDDIRIFHKAITETEVSLMYNSEKP